jgi:exonuclease VII small subunit
MEWVKDIESFYDFIGYVVLRAPDRFPVEDFLQDDEQMNLDRAFEELHKGIDLIDPRVADEEKKIALANMLEESLAAYESGDDVKGAHLLQDLEGMIFKEEERTSSAPS